MRTYGAHKAVDFTKKQVGVIFANAKCGNLRVEKWFMQEIYNLADYYGFDDNGSVAKSERAVKLILDAVFAKDFENAQILINDTADRWYSLYGKENQAKCDRSAFIN